MEDPCANFVAKIFVLYCFRCLACGHSYDEYLQDLTMKVLLYCLPLRVFMSQNLLQLVSEPGYIRSVSISCLFA